MNNRAAQQHLSPRFSWERLFIYTILSAILYVFMEWLFIITKPSSLSTVSFGGKVQILIFSASALAAACSLGLAVLAGVASFPGIKKFQNIVATLGALLPAGILASLSLLLIDNFTYTTLQFGIVSTSGLARLLYAIGYSVIFILILRFLLIRLSNTQQAQAKSRVERFGLPALLGSLVVGLLLTYRAPNVDLGTLQAIRPDSQARYPNIVLISGDGLDAAHTSVYGYERDTTPHLKELAQTSLVAENAFNNSANTMGSVVSMYTGKLPSTTRTLYPPDIVKGSDSYQHLPNILKKLGYYTIQHTNDYFGDAYFANLLDGFDEANGRSMEQNVVQSKINQFFQSDQSYFIYEVANRVIDRLRHIFFLKKMENLQELVRGEQTDFKDEVKVDKILTAIIERDQPVFAHLHYLGTHGPYYKPEQRTYSGAKNIDLQEKWDDDFYDDRIIDFDRTVGYMINELIAIGEYENTIVIVTSDHGQKYVTSSRIPLIIHFPGDEHQIRIRSNVQIIDLPVTLLDYLGIAQPPWMGGKSLLRGEPGNRPIFGFAVGNVTVKNGVGGIVASSVKPPFYQFGIISVVYCDQWYRMELGEYTWKTTQVEGHTAGCSENELVSDETVFQWMKDRLKADGFDITSLEDLSISQ